MAFVRDIWRDLVEKRLWPVALVLVAAMAAAPVLLARGAGSAAPAPAPAPAPALGADAGTTGSPVQPVRLDTSRRQPRPAGAYKDPFAGAARAQAQASSPTTPAPSAPASAPAPSAPAPGAPAAGAPAAGAPAAGPPAAPAHRTAPESSRGVFAGYRVDLQWGPAGAAKRMRDVVRLRRLDAARRPLLVYLGTRLDGRSALFLLATPATAAGDGRCLPASAACQVVSLRPGRSEFFDVDDGKGGITQYELDLDRIAKRRAPTAAQARRLRRASSKLGAAVVRAARAAGRDYVRAFYYDAARGVIRRDVKATLAWYRQATPAEEGRTGQ